MWTGGSAAPLPHWYVHGGYEGTDLRFCFFFPEKEAYQGRFFQFMAPAEGSETASIGRTGAEDRIWFALSHGAYFVESNMGSLDVSCKPDPTIVYRASAAAAEYSRVLAAELYGPHRPYGYIYGGSGGAFKTISCFENTSACDKPMLFIHGTLDDFIPYAMLDELYAAKPGDNKARLTAEGAGHGEAMYALGEDYWETVFAFLEPWLAA